MISQISSPNAPDAVGPYSQAIRAGNLLFVSGQLPLPKGAKVEIEAVIAIPER